MANVIKTGSDWLMAKLKSKAGTTVSLKRASAVTSGVTATVGSSTHQQIDELGGVVFWESRDYLIDAADYAFGGQTSEPKRGDRITETQDGVTHTYEVMGESGSVAWRWSDSFRTKYRIHTKRIKSSG